MSKEGISAAERVVWDMTLDALALYRNDQGNLDEDGCLRALMGDKYDKWNAALALARLGSAKSLSSLKETCLDKAFDVQCAAVAAIAAIAGPSETEFLISLLENKQFKAKHAAMIALLKHNHMSHVDVIWAQVVKWIQKPAKTPIQLDDKSYSSLAHLGLMYLDRAGELNAERRELIGKYLDRQEYFVVERIKALIS